MLGKDSCELLTDKAVDSGYMLFVKGICLSRHRGHIFLVLRGQHCQLDAALQFSCPECALDHRLI